MKYNHIITSIFVKVWLIINAYPIYKLTEQTINQYNANDTKIMYVLIPYIIFTLAPYIIVKAKDAAIIINAARCNIKG